MKILLFGRGVISTQYAWALEKAGHIVEFYVRPGRKVEFGETVNLNIYDARKKIRGVLVNERWNVKLREDLNSNHDYELIIVSVQHYHFKSAVDFLVDKIGNATVLILNNFWDEPQEAVSKLHESQLVWGFPLAGGGFDNKGVLNGTLWGSIIVGTFGTEPTERAIAVMNLFKSAGFKSNVTKDFRSWLFGHFVMNAALQLETLKYGTSFNLDRLKTTKHWRDVIANGNELLPLLKARNVNVKASPDLIMLSLPPWLGGLVMGLVMRVVLIFFPSVKQTFTGHSNPDELKSYCQDVMTTAEKMDINVPRFKENKNLFQSRQEECGKVSYYEQQLLEQDDDNLKLPGAAPGSAGELLAKHGLLGRRPRPSVTTTNVDSRATDVNMSVTTSSDQRPGRQYLLWGFNYKYALSFGVGVLAAGVTYLSLKNEYVKKSV